MKGLLYVLAGVFILIVGIVDIGNTQTINVLTTTEDLKSIVQLIGGNKVVVDSLGRGNQNYHFLEAKPSFMVKAKKADLFIKIGLELEIGYESLILEGSRNNKIQPGTIGYLDASSGIEPLDVHERVDRSMGDVHASGNPHYWLDPLNARIIATNIAHQLAKISSRDAEYFQKNLAEFSSKVDIKMIEWRIKLAPYKGEAIVTYHNSWVYFADRFGFRVIAELEPKPGIPPSPSHLEKVKKLIKESNVKVILQENIYKDDAARFIADKTNTKVVVVSNSVGGTKDATDYFLLMDAIVDELVKGLEG